MKAVVFLADNAVIPSVASLTAQAINITTRQSIPNRKFSLSRCLFLLALVWCILVASCPLI